MRQQKDRQPTPRFPAYLHGAATNSAKRSKNLDVVLQRLAWISQIALVIGAILGYILTVEPVRQKQLLDEQIAERTISLRQATATLDSLKSEAEKLRADNRRLNADANNVYQRLRSNLSVEILSFPDRCAIKGDSSQKRAADVPPCMLKYARERIFDGLRPNDRTLLQSLIEQRSAEMIAATEAVTKRFKAKSAQLDRDIKKAKADIPQAEADVRAEILRLRTARAGGKQVDPDPPTGRIIVRAPEDQKAYDDYAELFRQLNMKLYRSESEKINFDIDFEIAYRDALRSIAMQILNDFRRKTEHY